MYSLLILDLLQIDIIHFRVGYFSFLKVLFFHSLSECLLNHIGHIS